MKGLDGCREEFPGTARGAYLNTAAEGLASRGLRSALACYAADKELGSDGRSAMHAVETRCREHVDALAGVDADQIAFLARTARALGAVSAAIDWHPGDTLVTTDLEFPTTDLLATHLRGEGVVVCVARAQRGAVDPDELAALVDGRCRLVVASLVSYKTRAVIDLSPVSRACRAVGALLLVDATQGLGVVPFDLSAADIVVASAFKWLLSAHGVAVMYLNSKTTADLRPASVGWRSVRDLCDPERDKRIGWWSDATRFEEGMPAFPALYSLDAGLQVLSRHQPAAIQTHARQLASRLIEGLECLGAHVLTPSRVDAHAGIVTMADPACESHARLLHERGVVVWGCDGRLRASAHLYNDTADIDLLLDSMPDLAQRKCA